MSRTKKSNEPGSITHDTLYNGRLVVWQPAAGYRLSVDSLLLAEFCCLGRRASLCVDLGSGSGVVGLSILKAAAATRVVAIEVQEHLAVLSEKNAHENDLSRRYRVMSGDVRVASKSLPKGAFDLVVANPPFWPRSGGHLPSNPERVVACHELHGSIFDWAEAAAGLLRPRRGRFCVVFPARRTDVLLLALKEARLSSTRIRFVHPSCDRPAELVLVEARTGEPGRLVVEPPFALKDPGGEDSPRARGLYRGDFLREERGRTVS